MGPAEVADALRSAAGKVAKRRAGSEHVWEVSGDSAAHVALKTRILAACIAQRAYLLYGEPLEAPELRATIEELGGDRHRLTPGVPVEALAHWLYLGNWQMTSPACPARTIDVARAAPDAIRHFLDAEGIALLVDSFHDDTDWVVAFA